LSQDGAHGNFETIPAARQAQTGPLAQQRLQHRTLLQRVANGLWIGIEVKHASQLRYHAEHLHRLRAM
jgi:hypothetical protein